MSSSVSQLCHSSIICRPRTKTYEVLEGKSSVCGSFTAGLRDTPSSQITTPSLPSIHQLTKPLSFTFLSNNILDCSCVFSPNLTIYRHFHAKRKLLEIRKLRFKKKDQKHEHKQQQNQEKSPFFKCLSITGSAVVFTFVAFSLTDVWNSLLQGIKEILPQDFIVDVTQTLLLGSNLLVYILWKIPSLQYGMARYATITINSGFMPMLSSIFSHSSLFHLFINMYVLMSFVNAWDHYASSYRHILPQDLMSADKLLAFYLSAGLVGNAASLIVKHFGKIAVGSLGASGAILGLVGYICCKMPDGQLAIAFLPQYPFSSRSGLIAVMLFDTIGLLVGMATRWRYMIFDHAAHLGGLFFGIWYAKFGETFFYKWSRNLKKIRED